MLITYAVLANPGHNRVYFEQSKALSLAELEIACTCIQVPCQNYRSEEIGGVPYILFDTQRELNGRDIALLSRLSFAYALFRLEPEELALYPVLKQTERYVEESISSILKYSGKTNELFTRLMINVALFSSPFALETGTVLLDPVAGKGTTLFEGLAAGHHVMGVEIGDKAVHECCLYLKKYLENAKYKHTYHKERLSGENKSFQSVVHRFELARTKELFKPGRETGRRSFTMVAGDSRHANRYFKKSSVHLLVGDLPYGVAHGNVTQQKQTSLTRSPGELLKACLPAWREVLKPGGVLVLAWNTFVYPAAEMATLLEKEGFAVRMDGPYTQFEHRVDQAIRRDLIVAQKK